MSSESNSVSSEMINPWNETSLPTILSNCYLKDIYIEFGLFRFCATYKIYQQKMRTALVESIARFALLEWLQPTHWVKSYQ